MTRERRRDAAAVAVAGALTLLIAADHADTRDTPPGLFAAALLVAAAAVAALWWRRRHPVGVALALLPTTLLPDFTGGAVIIAVFTVAVHRPWRTAALLAAADAAIATVPAVVFPDPALAGEGFGFAALAIANLVMSAVLLAPAIAWGVAVRSRRELIASLRERAEEAEAAAAFQAERHRALERERIAREMHDVLGHRITLVSMHAGALEVRGDLAPEQITEVARTIRTAAHQALEELRDVLGVLRSDGRDGSGRPQPALTDLPALCEEARAAGTPVRLDTLPAAEAGDVPPGTGRTAYRLVQEGLTNARKHAPGLAVAVRVARAPGGGLHVGLRNALPAPDAPAASPPGSRSGLIGLAERVRLAGGRLEHGVRRSGDGPLSFHLDAWLPCPD